MLLMKMLNADDDEAHAGDDAADDDDYDDDDDDDDVKHVMLVSSHTCGFRRLASSRSQRRCQD